MPLLTMTKFIHHHNWNYLTGQQIVDLFDETFGDVEIQPNMAIVQQLKAMETATLECLENRTGSTVYRIRQKGVVFQLCQPNGDLFEFDDLEDYQQADPVDELVTAYESESPVHVAYEENGRLIIERKHPPRFKAVYLPNNKMQSIEIIKWIDPEPQGMMELPRLMRKAGAFLHSYFRNK